MPSTKRELRAALTEIKAAYADKRTHEVALRNELTALKMQPQAPRDVLIAVIAVLQAREANIQWHPLDSGDDLDYLLEEREAVKRIKDWATQEFHRHPPGERGGLYTEYKEEVDALRVLMKKAR